MGKERKLLFSVTLKDCRVDTFCSGGPGGQHQNKTQSGVRVTHPPSGAVGECREHKSQMQNKKEAFKRMSQTKQFRTWTKVEAARLQGEPSVDDIVEKQMDPDNIKVEIKDEKDCWTNWPDNLPTEEHD